MWLETLHYIQWNKCFIENLFIQLKKEEAANIYSYNISILI